MLYPIYDLISGRFFRFSGIRSASGCVAARCTTRVSGGHYNIDPDCSFSNAFITIKFELIRDATRLRTEADKGKKA